MSRISFEIPEDVERVLAALPGGGDATGEVRLAAAMKLFEIGRLSSGAAARLAGIPRTVLLTRLAEFDVDTFDQSEDDLRRELTGG